MGRRIKNLNSSEAVYAFAGWLSTRETPVTIGGEHDAAIVAELVNEFVTKHGLPAPRAKWDQALEVE